MSHFSPARTRTGLAFAIALCSAGSALAQNHLEPSLKTIPIPEPSTLTEYIADRDAAIRLGKAFF